MNAILQEYLDKHAKKDIAIFNFYELCGKGDSESIMQCIE